VFILFARKDRNGWKYLQLLFTDNPYVPVEYQGLAFEVAKLIEGKIITFKLLALGMMMQGSSDVSYHNNDRKPSGKAFNMKSGQKPFQFSDGIIVYAINIRNAQRKYNRLIQIQNEQIDS